MKHRSGFNKLSKKASHRKAMIRNMVTSLFDHERITTTKAKAKAIQVTAEKMVTRAKVDSVHNRRLIARRITDKAILAKLFTEIAPRFVDRNGGYTSIKKIGLRQGDAAEMVIIEFMKDEEEKPSKKKARKKETAKTEKKITDKAETKPASKKDAVEVQAEEVKPETSAKGEEKTEE